MSKTPAKPTTATPTEPTPTQTLRTIAEQRVEQWQQQLAQVHQKIAELTVRAHQLEGAIEATRLVAVDINDIDPPTPPSE